MSETTKPGPVQFEKYLLGLKKTTLSNISGIKGIEFLPTEGKFPCRLDIIPKNEKEMTEIMSVISSLDGPICLDVRQSHFYVDIDEKKFSQIRSTVLSMSEDLEVTRTHTTTTTTVKRKRSVGIHSSEISHSYDGLLLPIQQDFRALMISYDFSDLSVEPTQKNSIVEVKGEIPRVLQFCYEVLDPFKIQYSSSTNTFKEAGKNNICVILEEKTDYLMLVRKTDSASHALQHIEHMIDIRQLSNPEKIRLLTAYVSPEIVLEVAKSLGLKLESELPEGCTVVKTDDFYVIEDNTIKIKSFKP